MAKPELWPTWPHAQTSSDRYVWGALDVIRLHAPESRDSEPKWRPMSVLGKERRRRNSRLDRQGAG